MPESLMNFSEFCNKVKNTIFDYLPLPFMVQNGKYEQIDSTDEFGHAVVSFCVKDFSRTFEKVPVFPLEAAYENYKKIGGDFVKIINVIAVAYDTEYTKAYEADQKLVENSVSFNAGKMIVRKNDEMEIKPENILQHTENNVTYNFMVMDYHDDNDIFCRFVTNDMVDLTKVNTEKLFLTAQKNLKRLFPPKIETVDGSPEYGINNGYRIEYACSGLMNAYKLEDSIAMIDGNSFLILPLSDESVLVVPVTSVSEYEKCRDVYQNISYLDSDTRNSKIQLYGKDKKCFLQTERDIKNYLENCESLYKKNTVFKI